MGLTVGLNEGTLLVGNKHTWKVIEELGRGGFGVVYLVKTIPSTDGKKYAMKIELDNRILLPKPTLAMDLEVLKTVGGKEGFVPLVDAFKGKCSFGNPINCLVMGLVGMTIGALRKKITLSPKCIINCCDRFLTAIEVLHEAGYLHRDLKPDNWAIGQPPDHRKFYLIDMGMCRQFKHKSGRLRRLRTTAPGKGSLPYASRAAHTSKEQVAMDDIESWFYATIFLYARKLPWMAQVSKIMYRAKAEVYMKDSVVRKLIMADLPAEWEEILDMIRDRSDQHSPHFVNYARIHQILHETMDKYPDDHKYDWETHVPMSTFYRIVWMPWWKKPDDIYLKYDSTDSEPEKDGD